MLHYYFVICYLITIFYYSKFLNSAQGASDKVAIIKSGCYADILLAKAVSYDTTDSCFRWSYKTFTMSAYKGQEQQLECSIKICKGSGCAVDNMQSMTCPSGDTESVYNWKYGNPEIISGSYSNSGDSGADNGADSGADSGGDSVSSIKCTGVG